MHLETLRVRNFRRLRDVRIDLAVDISIFVGANNSGKTSAAQAVQLLVGGNRDRLSIHDFSASAWADFDAFGRNVADAALPSISLDIWFHVEPTDLGRAIDLIPRLSWNGSLVGLRVEFAAVRSDELLANFQAARARTRPNTTRDETPETDPRAQTLREYLSARLKHEYEFRYYVLDRGCFDDSLNQVLGYEPHQLGSAGGRGGREILRSLVLVDFLQAQRHLSDNSAGTRTGDLSQCLSRFYERNLEKREDDQDAMKALAESEAMLNEHLQRVFEPTLNRLSTLGYPGLTNPRLLIRSTLNPASMMSSNEGARVHYALGEPNEQGEIPTLPDRYGGLGFKNLIYIVVELLDLHARWLEIERDRPPIHLVFIEEPEAHMHAQLQQVFVRRVLDLLELPGEDKEAFRSQVVVTTHSPHILYERGFRAVRYFRRRGASVAQFSEILNLSEFHMAAAPQTRDFLERYLKLAHCDLFFADAAVLVEGNVERLLLGQMIESAAPKLKSAYLSVLEIGGAFAHRFRPLIEFLGITTLVITDLDSVTAAGEGPQRRTCMANVAGALTSNPILKQWLPRLDSVADLLAASAEDKTLPREAEGDSLVRVAYQTQVEAIWNETTTPVVGRTLEEAFAFENLRWIQDDKRVDLGLQLPDREGLTAVQLTEQLHARIKRPSFKKTDFALGLLGQDPAEWTVPTYIAEGLRWLESEVISGTAAEPQDATVSPTTTEPSNDVEVPDPPSSPDGGIE